MSQAFVSARTELEETCVMNVKMDILVSHQMDVLLVTAAWEA